MPENINNNMVNGFLFNLTRVQNIVKIHIIVEFSVDHIVKNANLFLDKFFLIIIQLQ